MDGCEFDLAASARAEAEEHARRCEVEIAILLAESAVAPAARRKEIDAQVPGREVARDYARSEQCAKNFEALMLAECS
jgi:hypothetical protein